MICNKLRAFVVGPDGGRYRPAADCRKLTFVLRKSMGKSCEVQQMSVEWTGYVLSNFTSYKLRLSILTEKQTATYFVNHRFNCYKVEKALWGNNNFLICL
jgi:hypothetical protein